MASRCINTLNDLDKISNRIYHKHSKGRFRAGVEAKLKASREKAERSLREIDEGFPNWISIGKISSASTSTATPSSRSFSISASTTSRSVNSGQQKKVANKKTSKPSPTKSISIINRQREELQRRKTKSCVSRTSVNNNNKQSSDNDPVHIPRAASVFGKYGGEGSEYKPTAWFNLPIETSIGVIDSFACGETEAPLCYSVNTKKGESEPKLLRHNLEVRVGQNGVVRTEKKRETEMSEDDSEDARLGKKRTAPLSWEEQLHWQNAYIISSEPQRDGISSHKTLCESHPVIFHKKKSSQTEKDSKRGDDQNHCPTYKLRLESRSIFADRRNLVSSDDKRITSVELEDTRCEEAGVVSSDRKPQTENCANLSDEELQRISNRAGKSPKKVSFKDGDAVKEKGLSTETKIEEKAEVNKEQVALVLPKTQDTDITVFANDRKNRPKTSLERSRTDDEETTKDVRKLQRPHTAPAAPPSSPRGLNEPRLHNFFPIRIPTSQGDEENNSLYIENDTNENQKVISETTTPEEQRQTDSEEEFSTFSVEITPGASPYSKDILQDGGTPTKRVTFGGCKSAPVSRTASCHEEVRTSRAKSSTALHRSPYEPTPPVVVESKSSLELPKDLPPAQALVALRKKIRDDLAQQNHDLQLDIQRLYLKKHSDH